MPFDLFEEITRLRRERIPAALATVVATKGSTPAKAPSRMIVRNDGTTLGTVGGGCIEAEIIQAARDAIDTGRTKVFHFRLSGEEAERTGIACGGMVDIMVESLEEPWVVIVGAGHVAEAVARLASRVGLRVLVTDDRPDFASKERFPEASEVRVVEFDRLGGEIRITPRTFILIMTRGHAQDFAVLKWAITTPARSIGVLGSKSKRIAFLENLKKQGISESELEGIHMPVGLDIGAETVEEIAVSVVAQLIAIRHNAEARRG